MATIEQQDIKTAMKDTTALAVVPVSIVFVVVYVILCVEHTLFFRGEYGWLMGIFAAVSAFIILLVGLYWRARKTNDHAHVMMAILSLVILFNLVVNMIATPDPGRTIFFVVYIFVVGLLVLSRPLFFALVLVGVSAWFLLVFYHEFDGIRTWAWLLFLSAGMSFLLNGQRFRAAEGATSLESQLRKHGRQLSELLKANELALADSEGMFLKLATASFEELGVHRFGIWLFNHDEQQLDCQFFVSSPANIDGKGAVLEQIKMPAYFDALQANRIIAAEDVINDPRTAELGAYLKENDIKSMLDGPIVVRGKVVGVVCNESVGTPKHWTVEEQTFAASVADIAALVIQSAERAELERRTLQAERLESLGILAGGVAHDFNNILTVIIGHTEILESMFADNSEAMKSVNSISMASESARDLASHMLNYSGRGTFLTHVAHLTDVIKSFCLGSGAEFLSQGLLKVDENEDPLPVRLEPSKIHQVLLNLVMNARDSGATEIVLATGKITRAAMPLSKLVITETLRADNYAWFDVADNGDGMSEETLTKMFDPFYTTKQFGSGLGLANVLGILRAHFGSIQVETRPGVGTRVRVYLPMDDSEIETRAIPHPAEKVLLDNCYRVLLVEDESRVRDITRRLLEDGGNPVVAFASYSDFATRVTETNLGEIDIALVDLTLGDGDGVQVISLLRGLAPELPVVLMSGYDAGAALARLNHDSPVVFLQKPFTRQGLLQALADARD